MVALIVISLFTFLFLQAEESPSIYQRMDRNNSTDKIAEVDKDWAYSGVAGETKSEYASSLSRILPVFEADHALQISPDSFPLIAIKLDTHLAPGIQTSRNLLDSILDWLNTRGYEKKDIVLFDREKDGLKEAGFISEEQGTLYNGYRVLHSLDEDYFMDGWFHDSPLPPTSFDRAKYILKFPAEPKRRQLEERKSYLPALLFKDAFWINLAVPMDDVFLGVDGAAANISLGSVNNYGRFLQKKTMAPATVAEIMAIPEIWEKRIFSILDFSNYQVANGQRFDSKYAEKQNRFYLSRNPFSLDFIAWKTINSMREKRKLSRRELNNSLLFRYAQELGLGVVRNTQVKYFE